MQQTVRAFSFIALMALVGAAHAAQEDPQKVIAAYRQHGMRMMLKKHRNIWLKMPFTTMLQWARRKKDVLLHGIM
ncbi:hypothetical protein F975_01362 [Acinetobacter sp. ANC 3789]|uniref:hypothetical protein n=1 Tax=Acinetobacter sp. ANC 3789 TaxID=1217714 RepID=UPI0002CF07DF|nr:hypothetical protein [Acinetobacter sp. ANC 3789]ENU80815.1 hypothetical protein F975_01362 [Acinetobacter sp. ANC 3789]